MFKKTLIAILLSLSPAVSASGINIETTASLNALKSPVVFDIKASTGINFKTVAKDLEQTGKIESYFGTCKAIENKIHRQAACVTASEYQIEIKVPNKNANTVVNYIINSDNDLPVADAIYKAALNTQSSPYLVKIAYVSKNKRTGVYKLAIANYKGGNARVLFSSPEPILSPSWSHDGKYLTYISYETVRGSIFIHDVNTNHRKKVFEQRGLNAYPSFAASDHEVLISASGQNENSHIYKLNVLNHVLKKTKVINNNINAIYPRELNGGDFVFVALDKHDAPYLMHRNKNGSSEYVRHFPLNAPSVDKKNDIVAINGNKLIKLRFNAKKWDNQKVIAINSSIESPSISNNGVSVFYIFEKKGKNLIANSLISGKKIITISSPTENIIQVSAF